MFEIMLIVALGCPGDFNCQQAERQAQQGWLPVMPAMPLPNDADRHPGEGPLSANPNDPESVYNPSGLYGSGLWRRWVPTLETEAGWQWERPEQDALVP